MFGRAGSTTIRRDGARHNIKQIMVIGNVSDTGECELRDDTIHFIEEGNGGSVSVEDALHELTMKGHDGGSDVVSRDEFDFH